MFYAHDDGTLLTDTWSGVNFKFVTISSGVFGFAANDA
mgnify:CR=1 FL=1